MNYQHLHEQPFIGEAIQYLFNALVRYKRSTGRDYLVMTLPKYPNGIAVSWRGGRAELAGAILTARELLPKFKRGNRDGLHHDYEVAEALHYLLRLLAAHERILGKTELFLLLPFSPVDENPVCFLGRVHIGPHEMCEELKRIARAYSKASTSVP